MLEVLAPFVRAKNRRTEASTIAQCCSLSEALLRFEYAPMLRGFSVCRESHREIRSLECPRWSFTPPY